MLFIFRFPHDMNLKFCLADTYEKHSNHQYLLSLFLVFSVLLSPGIESISCSLVYEAELLHLMVSSLNVNCL